VRVTRRQLGSGLEALQLGFGSCHPAVCDPHIVLSGVACASRGAQLSVSVVGSASSLDQRLFELGDTRPQFVNRFFRGTQRLFSGAQLLFSLGAAGGRVPDSGSRRVEARVATVSSIRDTFRVCSD